MLDQVEDIDCPDNNLSDDMFSNSIDEPRDKFDGSRLLILLSDPSSLISLLAVVNMILGHL